MFRRTIQRYGETPEPVTPYQKAAQAWDDRIGSRARAGEELAPDGFWIACASLSCSPADSSGNPCRAASCLMWWKSTSSVVCEAVGPAIQHYQPNDAQIAYFLAHFITDVRSLSIDPVVVRNNWLEAYDYATDHGAVFLNDYRTEERSLQSYRRAHRLGAGDERGAGVGRVVSGEMDRSSTSITTRLRGPSIGLRSCRS